MANYLTSSQIILEMGKSYQITHHVDPVFKLFVYKKIYEVINISEIIFL